MILDPPKAEVGMVYNGRVVNITKFGAFVNILPGRDGLIHISKLGQGRRVDKVEDVLDLGDEIEVRVDDIDPQGKVSLSLASSPPEASNGGSSGGRSSAGGSREQGSRDQGSREQGSGDAGEVSFEDTWEAEAQATSGDLGPSEMVGSGDRGAGDRGPRRNPRRRRRFRRSPAGRPRATATPCPAGRCRRRAPRPAGRG